VSRRFTTIQDNGYRRGAYTFEGHCRGCSADIEPRVSTRIFGTYANHVGGPKAFDRTFRIGDEANTTRSENLARARGERNSQGLIVVAERVACLAQPLHQLGSMLRGPGLGKQPSRLSVAQQGVRPIIGAAVWRQSFERGRERRAGSLVRRLRPPGKDRGASPGTPEIELRPSPSDALMRVDTHPASRIDELLPHKSTPPLRWTDTS